MLPTEIGPTGLAYFVTIPHLQGFYVIVPTIHRTVTPRGPVTATLFG